MAPVVELLDDIEGDRVDTSDFFFDKIGAPVPVKPSKAGDDDCALYDPENLPFQALAVSERSGLIFVAHTSGFCVARTIDVMESAKELKEKNSGPSIVELSIVDVCIGKVDILSLSTDSSTLAASVGRDVHFYSVDSLLAKIQEPLFSCSVDESDHFKVIRWVNEKDSSYILLSNHGRLYHGNVGSPPKLILEDVDAVDVRGNHIAVVRRKNLSILSSNLKEKLCISLLFDSWNEDCDVEVDSVRWIRPGCFVLGCYKLTPEGMEEYFLEVIRSKHGKINHASAAMEAQSFYDVFAEINDDIVPAGHGPYLFFSYLEQCKLGIAAHKKNVGEHVVLFSWSLGEEQDDAVVVDINRDKWLPRIELQENGDDNLIVGLCIDKVNLHEKVKLQDGVEDKELSPHCFLLCLTVEGTLIMFNLASEMECTGSPEDVPLYSDEEEPAEVSKKPLQSIVSSRSEEGNFQNAPAFQFVESQTTLDSKAGFGIPVNSALKPVTIKEALNQGAQAEKKDEVSQTREAKPFAQLQVSHAGEQQKLMGAKPLFGPSSQNLVGHQSASFGQYSKSPLLEESPKFGDDLSKRSSMPVTGKTFSPASFEGSLKGFGQSVQNGVMAGQKSPATVVSSGFQVSSSQTLAGNKDAFARTPESRFTFQSNEALQDRSESTGITVSSASFPGSFVGKLEHLKEAHVPSPTLSSSIVPSVGTQKTYPNAEQIEPLPSVRASQIYFQENSSDISSNDDFLSKYKKSISQPGMSKMESSMSKQFGNVKEMVNELDMLLESIEKKGGFKDSCIVSHRSQVEALEQGIETLSHQCTMWKSTMDERLSEAQQLLDKSVEVMARKVYLEGIFRQTTDEQYWDLWSRQKLSPELELKRRQITKLNQELTDQLILLERHFNALELNKFGDGIGAQGSRRAMPSKSASSRHLQSLHTLQKTMSSQIAAAEQLSDCLSKQMAVLKIDSPPVKPKNVRKELFETIGLPYDDSFSSPVTSKVSSTAAKKFVPSSNSAAARDHQSRRNQLSATKTSEPESARRRRDSLGQGWASFEPSKTTVRRMSLQESQKSKSSSSSLVMDEQYLSSSERSTTVQRSRITPSALSQQPAKSMKEKSPMQIRSPFEPVNDFQGSGLNQSATQRSPFSVSAAKSPFDHSQSKPNGGNVMFADKTTPSSTTQKSMTMTSPFNQSKAESNFQQMPSFSVKPPFETTPTRMKSSEVSAASSKATVTSQPSFEMAKQGPKITEDSVSPFGKREDSSSSTTTSTVTQGKVQPGEIKVSSTGFKFDSSSAVSGFTLSSSQSAVPSNKTGKVSGSLPFSRAATDSNQSLFTKPSFSLTTPSTSIPSVSSSPSLFSEAAKPVTSSATDANQGPFPKFSSPSTLFSGSSSSISSSSPSPFSVSSLSSLVKSTTESQKPEAQPDLGKLSPKLDVTTPKEALPAAPKPVNDESPTVTEVSQASIPTVETPAVVAQESTEKETTSAPAITISKPEAPAATAPAMTISTPQAPAATAGFQFPSQKTENLDVNASVEDDMDEEAPEATSNTPSLSLGNLSSFGLGSAPTSTPPKANPFGGPFSNTAAPAATSSPFAPTPPSGGDLFRPASFSFQSPVTSQPSPPQSTNAFSGGFGSAPTLNSQSPSGGQQVLGSVLGSFGQSRQIGSGIPGFGFAAAPSSGFGGGASLGGAATAGGGFAAAATSGGGFASLASSSSSGFGGGFAGAATSSGGGFGGFAAAAQSSSGGGFGGFAGAAATSSGGGFGGFAGATPAAGGGFGGFAGAAAPAAGGGFAAAAAPGGGSGLGFGAFGGGGGGGFSSFGGGGGAGGSGNPSSLFTQMRK